MPGATEDLSCGRCGSQNRFCTSRRVWEYSDCVGEHGVCDPGTRDVLACGGEMVAARCTDACILEPVDATLRCPLADCAAPLELAARAGETVSVSFDTTYGEPGPRDLAPCIFSGASRAPQVIVAVRVPGTARRALAFTTANEGTSPGYDTDVVALRGDCAAPDAVACYPDTPPDPTIPGFEPRASGRLGVMGGETLYLAVTSSAAGPAGRGSVRLDVTLGESIAPPMLRSASLQVSPESAVASFEGSDADGDATALAATFLDAAGMPVDLDGSGTVDAQDDHLLLPDVPLAGMTTFAGAATAFGPFLSDRLGAIGAVRARVRLRDELGLESDPLTIPFDLVTLVGFGDACDASHACRAPLACVMGTCSVSPEALALCASATTLAFSGTPGTAMVTGSLGPGGGLFVGTCGSTPDAEQLYRATVPAGAFDLLLSTGMSPMGTDTVLYVRRDCADERTTVACVDDVAGDLRSRLTITDAMPGDYTIFVERYGSPAGSTAYTLTATLRPVLGAGATCDPAGALDRCSTGTCTMGMCPAAPP